MLRNGPSLQMRINRSTNIRAMPRTSRRHSAALLASSQGNTIPCIACAGDNISSNDNNHAHGPKLAMDDVKRKDFMSYFDYITAKWQVAHHCRQVFYSNSACGRKHFHALDCQRKRKRPRRDQTCCGKREWILDTADEKCKHPECLSDKVPES